MTQAPLIHLAYHESGHACIRAVALGGRAQSLSICSEPLDRRRRRYWGLTHIDREHTGALAEHRLWRAALTHMAGYAAELRLLGHADLAPSRTDLQRARHCLSRLDMNPDQAWDCAWQATIQLVDQQRSLIDRTVEALIAKVQDGAAQLNESEFAALIS